MSQKDAMFSAPAPGDASPKSKIDIGDDGSVKITFGASGEGSIWSDTLLGARMSAVTQLRKFLLIARLRDEGRLPEGLIAPSNEDCCAYARELGATVIELDRLISAAKIGPYS